MKRGADLGRARRRTGHIYRLECGAEGNRRERSTDPRNRCVEVVESVFLNLGRDLCAKPTEAKLDKAADMRKVRDESPTTPIEEGDLPNEIRKSFVSAHGQKYLMKAYPEVMTWLVSNNIRFTEEVRAGDNVSDVDIGPIGTAMMQ